MSYRPMNNSDQVPTNSSFQETQTNDDLLINRPQEVVEPEYNKKPTLHITQPEMFNAYQVQDILDNPSLTAQYGLASVSFVVLSKDEVLVSCPKCGNRKLRPVDYLIRKVGTHKVAVQEHNNGIDQIKFNHQLYPLGFMTQEDLLSNCQPFDTNKKANWEWENNRWIFEED